MKNTDVIDKLYKDEYDALEMQFIYGVITQDEFDKQLRALERYCDEQVGLREEYEMWNVGRPNF